MVGAALSVAACAGGDDDGADATLDTTSSSASSTSRPSTSSTTSPDTTTVESTTSSSGDSSSTTTESTFAEVTSVVIGTAVGGNSGGVGEGSTNSFSETIRNEDGSCSGWAGPGGTWTQGLEDGAPVVFLDRNDDQEIGTGVIESSSWADVDPSSNEQWNCTFSWSGTVRDTPDSFRMKVADLPPWIVFADTADPGAFVASVSTLPRVDAFSSCTEQATDIVETGFWSVVGQYWSNGVPSLCDAGLVVARIDRVCRPAGFASDYISAVTSTGDPAVVYEDADGLRPEGEALAPYTEVAVQITIGRACP